MVAPEEGSSQKKPMTEQTRSSSIDLLTRAAPEPQKEYGEYQEEQDLVSDAINALSRAGEAQGRAQSKKGKERERRSESVVAEGAFDGPIIVSSDTTNKKVRYVNSETQTDARPEERRNADFSPEERKRHEAYFEYLMEYTRYRDLAILLVSHPSPGRDAFFKAINLQARLLGIITKGQKSEAKQLTREEFKNKGFPITELGKKECKNANTIVEYLKGQLVNDDETQEKLIIIDHGGYFAESINEIHSKLKGHYKRDVLIGVIDSTSNGEAKYIEQRKSDSADRENSQQYEKFLLYQSIEQKPQNFNVPVISLAHSELKDRLEPALADSVKRGVERILNQIGIPARDLRPVILGSGPLGQNITQELSHGTHAPTVYDIKGVAKMSAEQAPFSILSSLKKIPEDALVICATGNKVLDNSLYPHIPKGCYVATVTSADDELVEPDPEHYDSIPHAANINITKYINKKQEDNYFYLLNNGEAVNFVDNMPAVGRPMLALQGLEMLMFQRIYHFHKRGDDSLSNGLHKQPAKLEQEYASAAWEHRFGKGKQGEEQEGRLMQLRSLVGEIWEKGEKHLQHTIESQGLDAAIEEFGMRVPDRDLLVPTQTPTPQAPTPEGRSANQLRRASM